jgi:hypothetical protein
VNDVPQAEPTRVDFAAMLFERMLTPLPDDEREQIAKQYQTSGVITPEMLRDVMDSIRQRVDRRYEQ